MAATIAATMPRPRKFRKFATHICSSENDKSLKLPRKFCTHDVNLAMTITVGGRYLTQVVSFSSLLSVWPLLLVPFLPPPHPPPSHPSSPSLKPLFMHSTNLLALYATLFHLCIQSLIHAVGVSILCFRFFWFRVFGVSFSCFRCFVFGDNFFMFSVLLLKLLVFVHENYRFHRGASPKTMYTLQWRLLYTMLPYLNGLQNVSQYLHN